MPPPRRVSRLAHGWRLAGSEAASADLLREYIRPAVRAVPPAMAVRLPRCEFSLPVRLDDGRAASRWTLAQESLRIAVAAAGVEPHDIALELLICLGQALWDVLSDKERAGWLQLLRAEIEARVPGEMDEETLGRKRALLAGPAAARSRRRLDDYAVASFASTAAEYVHALWHDVHLRSGPGHLPAGALRRRLEFMARHFPPGRGYRLFPRGN